MSETVPPPEPTASSPAPARFAHGVYGTIPEGLVSVPAGAAQFSPLMPGAADLETIAAASMTSMTMLAPPGTLERRYAVARALMALEIGGELVVLAANNRGGKRLGGELAQFGLAPSLLAKAHYRICRCRRPADLEGIDQALQNGALHYVREIQLWSQPGVFSWNQIDPGSRLLAEHLPVFAGRGADLGCGAGYLAASVLASASVEALALVDIDRRAIAAATRNVGDPRACFHWLDAAGTLPFAAPLDFVVSNPPFHRDGSEDRQLGLAIVRQASAILRKGGVFWLVVNKHLPYLPVLHDAFSSVSSPGENAGYRLYCAVK